MADTPVHLQDGQPPLASGSNGRAPHIDLLTIVAIAIVTYLASTIMHEALGHGLVALILGMHPTRVTSVDLEVSFNGVAAWKMRSVAAAGCVANVVLALIAIFLFLTLRTKTSAATRFFFWLLATNNLLIPGGYMMVLTFLGFGDWNDFVQGLPNQFAWRLAITIVGVVLSLLGLFWGIRSIDAFLGREGRGKRAILLTLTAYLAGGIANTLAGVLNPTSAALVITSAAASSFGGTIWLLWINVGVSKPRVTTPATPLTPQRSLLWLALGVLALLIYFLVLGPGLPRATLF
jgi:hypothetical protein